MLVSPTEREPISSLGRTSGLPERWGMDLLWRARGAWWGVQRKAVPDLVASVMDDRLGKELGQSQRLLEDQGRVVLVVEGRATFTSEGVLVGGAQRGAGSRWTRAQHQGVLLSIQERGWWVLESRDANDTCDVVRRIVAWSQEKHGLRSRGGPVSQWGHPSSRDWQEWMLQGLPGVGAETAARVVDAFGRVPLRWDVTEEELMKVDGLGPKKVRRMMEALG